MSNYWTKRFEEEEKQRNISNKAYAKEIEKQYKIAENKIKSDIEKWYIRIADNNQISLADAKKLLTKDELKEFKWTLAEYTQKAKSGAWKKELENVSARVHIQRLEALQLQVQNSIETLRNKENEMLEDYLIKNYEDTYYHSLYEISKGLNLKTSFATLDKNKINQVIGKPWLSDGKTFSDRIWQDKEQLINTLRTKITQSFITGSTLDEAVEDISKFVSDKIKNKEYVARRLLETESAAYASKAQIEAFKSIDVEKYEIVATLDLHTSEICQEMDGKVFNISDQEIGVTVPPFHSHCRTVIAPYFDDEPTRASRDENGEYKEVKYMNYKEWKDQYIKKDELGLTLNQKSAIMRYIGSDSYKINEALRNGINLTQDQKEWVKVLDEALEKIPVYEGQVTRSLSFQLQGKEALEEFLKLYNIGKEIEYPAYTSATIGEIYNPSGEVQLTIISKTARNITTLNKGEQEILFERGKKFKVLQRIEIKGKHFIQMEEL
ncbi:minor capsid protein [Fusobacterium polymorphum]|uniref:minor capsid protein n=1 Tax=Fusobacterium nucleatum subsp. polymorphum TaxID=76857 RepID=UPI0020524A10|nr:MAG TPA: minor capsid protein [Caudoviricetes sp.]